MVPLDFPTGGESPAVIERPDALPDDPPANAAGREPGRVSNAAMATDLTILSLKVSECALIVVSGLILLNWVGSGFPPAMVGDHIRLSAFGALLYLTIASVNGAYDVQTVFVRHQRLKLLVQTWGITGLVLVALGFVLKASTQISREWALLWFSSTAVALWGVRVAVFRLLNRSRGRGVFDVRTAVFGGGKQAAKLLEYLAAHPELTIRVVGRYDDRSSARKVGLPPRLGGLSALLGAIRRGEVDQVIVSLPWSSEERVQEVVQQLALTPVRIRLAPDHVRYAYIDKPYALLGTLPVVTLFDRPISGLDQSIKLLEDQILGWSLLLLLAPLFAAVAIAIRLDSPGPIFFRQLREGFNDQQFRVWKFRSMYADKCDQGEIRQAVESDGRVTRVGAFLRRTSLDEIPQLFNVVGGEMSLVGPRPHAPSTKAGKRLFRDVVSTYAARHRVKPGITGWAQVNGWRGPTDTDEKLVKRLEHDLHYIENWSLGFDFKILLRTLVTPLHSPNAF
jgi:Undecaprenyl-phosphate glucose phosphotransferase